MKSLYKAKETASNIKTVTPNLSIKSTTILGSNNSHHPLKIFLAAVVGTAPTHDRFKAGCVPFSPYRYKKIPA